MELRSDDDLRKRFSSMKNELSMKNKFDENKIDTDDDEDTSQDVCFCHSLNN